MINFGLRRGLNMTDEEILAQNKEQRQETECWCRCMGYYRPVSHYNIGKKQEYADRKWFTEKNALKGLKEQQKDVA